MTAISREKTKKVQFGPEPTILTFRGKGLNHSATVNSRAILALFWMYLISSVRKQVIIVNSAQTGT